MTALSRQQLTVTDNAGNVVAGAWVEVRQTLVGGQPFAALYSDRDGATPLDNPFQADSDGFAYFHAEAGVYRVRAYTGLPGAPDFERIWDYVSNGSSIIELDYSTDGALADDSDGLIPTQKAVKSYVDDSIDNAVASPRNHIVNGAMMVSQENGTTAVTTSGSYPVDQFFVSFSNGGAISAAQVASITPGGSPNRLRVTVTSPDASVAASDIAGINQRIEGLRVADLRSGSTDAKTVTLQFGVKAPAGVYCVSIRNAAGNRSYVAEYTISAGEANTNVVKSVTIALDQAGTWAVDTSVGLDVWFGLMCGSTFQTAAGAWTAGNYTGSSNQFNFMGTVGNVFELFDVGLYEGSLAPSFEVPDYPRELAVCQRYYYRLASVSTASPVGMAVSLSSASGLFVWSWPVPMRATPTVTATGSGAYRFNGATSAGISSFSFAGTTLQTTRGIGTVSSGLTAGNAYDVESASGSGSFVANARM